MIIEAFQAAVARNADAILMMAISFFALSGGIAFLIACSMIIGKRRPGYQPSIAGDRTEPPRSGSGAQPPVDQSARVARLRAELNDLIYAAQGGNACRDNPEMLKWVAERCVHQYGESPNVDFVITLRTRAYMLEEALKNARGTLEATKSPPPKDWAGRRL